MSDSPHHQRRRVAAPRDDAPEAGPDTTAPLNPGAGQDPGAGQAGPPADEDDPTDHGDDEWVPA